MCSGSFELGVHLCVEKGGEAARRRHWPVQDGIDGKAHETCRVEGRRRGQDGVDQLQHVLIVAYLGRAQRGGLVLGAVGSSSNIWWKNM